ncbi:hypothetical protein [Streptomyces sp. NPDC005573]|uniref:hypothetical protein n=1 Tax=unclassified Streptomyces TaxID=2593676 RepID=UPI0033AD96AD
MKREVQLSITEQTPDIVVHILAEKSSVEELLAALAEEGIQARPVEALGSSELAEILLSAGVLAAALPRLIASVSRHCRRGLVIDLYDGDVSVKKERSLPRGVIVVRDHEGKVLVKDVDGDVHGVVDVMRAAMDDQT